MANFSINYIYQIKDHMSPVLKRITRLIQEQNKLLDRSAMSWKKIADQQSRYNRNLKPAVDKTEKFTASLDDSVKVFAAQSAGAYGLGRALLKPIKAAASYEKALIGVAKAANLTKGTEQYEETSKKIRQMSVDFGIAQEGIAGMFEAGARLGVANKDLDTFAKLSAKVSLALDMTPEAAGQAIAKMKNTVGVSVSEMEGFLNIINHLDSSTAATGADLINILNRSGAALSAAGIGKEMSAGLAAVAAQIMPSPELAASGLAMTMNRIMSSEMAGDFLQAPKESLDAIIASLKGMDKVSRNASIKKIFGEEAGRFVTGLVERSEVFKNTLAELGSGEISNSMQNEVDKVLNSVDVLTARSQAQLNDVMIQIGKTFEPITKAVLQFFITFAGGVAEFVQNNKSIVLAIGAVAAAIAVVNASLAATKAAMIAVNFVFRKNPIIMIIYAIIAAVTYCYNEFDSFKKLIDDIAAQIWDFFEFAGNRLKEFFFGKDVEETVEGAADKTPIPDKSESKVTVEVVANNAEVKNVETTQVKGRNKVEYATQMAGA